MKILSLTICNYKNYCGSYRFDFDVTDPAKNLTLIGGKNGAGKTSFFESIKICMFGYQFDGKPIPQQQYQDYLRGCYNKTAKKEGDTRFFVEMEVVLDDVEPVYTVTLRREWEITGKSLIETFTITRDGHPFEIVERENWQQYIYDMFPPYTIEYFFFDGEKMDSIISGERADKLLRDSARDLIGLKIYDTLLTDVGVLKDKIKKSTKKDEKNKAEYDRLTNEAEAAKKRLDHLAEKENELNTLITDSEKEIEEIREEIQRKAGAFAREHDTYQSEIQTLKSKVEGLNAKIADSADFVPFLMVVPLMKKALTQLNNERTFRDSSNELEIVEKIRSHLAKEFDGKKDVMETVDKTLDSFKSEYQMNQVVVVHDVNNAVVQRFSEFLSDIRTRRKKEFSALLLEREQVDYQLQKLLSEKRKMPDEAFVAAELAEIEKRKESVAKARQKLAEIHMERGALQPKYDEAVSKVNEIDTASLKLVEDKSKYLACEKLESILEDYISYILTTKVQLLENTISTMYKKLENKDDLVERMHLNPSTFELTLIGYDGEVVNKRNLSSGEKEIYAISVLWGLSQLSKNHLPIVVDSLLARLDQSHVGKVTEIFLPSAGKQVLILSHNREVNKQLYPLIKPCLSAEYLLTYDQKNKLTKGYFKEWE